MVRGVEECPFRIRVRRRGETEVAECRLLEWMLGREGTLFPIGREACEHCCRLAPPSLERPNAVIASLLYEAGSRIIGADGVSASGLHEALQMQRWVLPNLETVSSPSQHGDTGASVSRALAPGRLIDQHVTVDSYTEHLKRREPFSYLRYSDSECVSMLAIPGVSGGDFAEHRFFPETAGRELRASLDYVGSLSPGEANVYVGVGTKHWYQFPLQAYLQARGLRDKIRWVDVDMLQHGLRDLSTKRFLEAVRDFDGPKYLVANRWLASVARGLGCAHVTIPETDCYLEINRVERACRFRGTGLVLLCASIATECLVYRLHRRNPSAVYVDCGHVFDAIVWRPSRCYTRDNDRGILQFLKEHYAPMFHKTGAA